MPVSGPHQEHNQSTREEPAAGAGTGVDDGRADDALAARARAEADDERAAEPVVEIDERRAKMERLRAEGIDPYPHVRLPDRTKIADVYAAHDPSQLAQGEHPELPYHVAGRLT